LGFKNASNQLHFVGVGRKLNVQTVRFQRHNLRGVKDMAARGTRGRSARFLGGNWGSVDEGLIAGLGSFLLILWFAGSLLLLIVKFRLQVGFIAATAGVFLGAWALMTAWASFVWWRRPDGVLLARAFGASLVLLMTIAPILWLGATWDRHRSLRNIQDRGKVTQGIVTELGDTRVRTSMGRVISHLHTDYSYTVGGRAYTGRMDGHRYNVGDELDIHYLAGDPYQHHVGPVTGFTMLGSWVFVMIVVLAGLINIRYVHLIVLGHITATGYQL